MRLLILLLFPLVIWSQNPPETEVFLFDITSSETGISIQNGINISNNPGYDNQPSFYDDETVLFAKTRGNLTDVAGYSLKFDKTFWLNTSPLGGEYSPQRIPNSKDFTAVRLDTTGLQRLYRYDIKTTASVILIPEYKIAYYAFYDETTLVASVINGDKLNLILFDLANDTQTLITKNSGRSIQKVPGTNSISYTVINDEQQLDLYLLELSNEGPESYFVCTLPIGIQDCIWINETQILLGSGKQLFLYDTLGQTEWKSIADLSTYGLKEVTRMAISPDGSKLSLVAEPDALSPARIVQKQLDAYNALDIDAFAATYADEVQLYNYPNQLVAEGKAALYKNYASFFEKTPDLRCEIKNRIVIGNKVIDEELVTINGQTITAVAIYEIAEGKIIKVTFIR